MNEVLARAACDLKDDGLVQERSHPPIAAFGDAAGVIDLARLIPPGHQA
jgi:hypothetical protein